MLCVPLTATQKIALRWSPDFQKPDTGLWKCEGGHLKRTQGLTWDHLETCNTDSWRALVEALCSITGEKGY